MSQHYHHDNLWERGYKIGAHSLGAYASHRLRNYFQSSRERSAKAKWNARLNMGAHNRMEESELTQDGRSNASFSSGGSIITGTPAANRAMNQARRVLRGVRASSTRPTAMKASMFLPGKGAEVDIIHNNNLQPIIHKVNYKVPRLRYDGVSSALVNPKGNRISMDFAVKMILECQTTGMTGAYDPNNPNDLPSTRLHNCHIFRHTNQNAGLSSIQSSTGIAKAGWHTSLGPDASYVRLTPSAGGTMRGTYPGNYPNFGPPSSAGGFTNTLHSPYRLPNQGETMYSRLTLQMLENYGWNLNPFKLTGDIGEAANKSSLYANEMSNAKAITTLGGTVPIVKGPFGNVNSFANAPTNTDDSGILIERSLPHLQNQYTGVSANSTFLPSANKYITQHGPGGVRYSFSNDGTNAVCLECVLIGFKDGVDPVNGTSYGLNEPYQAFMRNAGQAYLSRMKSKVGVKTMHGDPHTQTPQSTLQYGTAIFSNAETEFIPNNIWPFMGKTGGVSDSGTVDVMMNPFKFISRDQFMIGGGQTRVWKTSFPSDVYNAAEDSPQYQCNVNSHSFMLIWGLCSAPLPCMEQCTTVADKIMLSREPQNCNVSMTATYHETPTPVYADVTPTPINLQGSLAQVTVIPSDTNSWPAGSAPITVPDPADPQTVYHNVGDPTSGGIGPGMIYVDLPRSGQQPFTTNVKDTLQIGTLTTQE